MLWTKMTSGPLTDCVLDDLHSIRIHPAFRGGDGRSPPIGNRDIGFSLHRSERNQAEDRSQR